MDTKIDGRGPVTIWGIELELAWERANAKWLLKMWEQAIPKYNGTIDTSKIVIYGTK